ncbi:unnamed protein product, partial [marine sediment metagenome]
ALLSLSLGADESLPTLERVLLVSEGVGCPEDSQRGCSGFFLVEAGAEKTFLLLLFLLLKVNSVFL